MLPNIGQEFTIEKVGQSLRITPNEEIDINTANILSKNINENIDGSPSLQVVFNLSKVKYINSSAIGVIAGIAGQYQKLNLDIFLLNPQKSVHQILEQCGITELSRVCYSESELPESIRIKEKQ